MDRVHSKESERPRESPRGAPASGWDGAQEGARAAGREAGREVAAVAEQGRRKVRTEVGAVAGALRAAGDALARERDAHDGALGALGTYADRAARQTERAADYLESRDLEDMIQDLRGLARRRPELVLGGMFVAGIALGRLLRSQPDRRGSRDDGRYRDDAEWASFSEPGRWVGDADPGSAREPWWDGGGS